ncbi:glycoside hydrolase family 30 beta sandwich domain-containing protein [Agriterribacter sp.]|uniref:glycoside hydrolase family 30 protein n=1 Tax=Agriterribacter sp. TaxID=2821509 RepID=UPI002CBE330E|nr:glycoside hydrolase family 30 beta sandwich domain-containing protein [Agriterribacter sp.]HRO46166.1 glycoside hydrolase family 30 beta sandwich domain-containing protein [Agriterribacter sp.]HRQ16280.1 glycoside hydrolase family 30 beta sandwich domain-containing protein [Agriterribacter sp.]
MPKHFLSALLLLITAAGCKTNPGERNGDADTLKAEAAVWLTDPDAGVLFKEQPAALLFADNIPDVNAVIDVDDSKTFQTIDGFGYTLTGGSAMHLHNMDAAGRATLLKELFATDGNNIGVSYLRVSIGASDLDDRVFSYDDLPAGQTDEQMEKFSIAPDQVHLIPVLKEILAINPAIKILGSPWSPPTWMKTNNNTVGGSLKPAYYNAYAKYFVKYIEAMKAEGIAIDAVTVQNEPLHPGNNPSLLMQAEEQAAFIKQSLGPAFKAAGINTKIIVYDHNADRPDYPATIYKDADAAQYVDGAAFHLYGGNIDTLAQLHNAYPDKHLYFTEQWIGAPGNIKGDLNWHIKNVIIGAMRNWCRVALEWNLAANTNLEPHTPGGCTQCLGALTIEGNMVTRNPAYYIIAHASKFVRPGAVRIASGQLSALPNVAFKNTDGKTVLIVLNETDQPRSFTIKYNNKQASAMLNGGAVATYVW